jgi:hypothetical protein
VVAGPRNHEWYTAQKALHDFGPGKGLRRLSVDRMYHGPPERPPQFDQLRRADQEFLMHRRMQDLTHAVDRPDDG